ncbi:MAG: YraN family protein [Gammaproteobacteria bacterium]|nr:YraN family protein [Gammaproteobacteria bacterium]
MTLTARQQSGKRAEQLAAQFLRAAGCEILQTNFRRRLGELDIIARAAQLLVIAEVRPRERGLRRRRRERDPRQAAPHHPRRAAAAAAAQRPRPPAGAFRCDRRERSLRAGAGDRVDSAGFRGLLSPPGLSRLPAQPLREPLRSARSEGLYKLPRASR